MILTGCGGGTQDSSNNTAAHLVESLPLSGLNRTGEIRTFVGDSLWEYINGGAELYHEYDFIEVVTADYVAGEEELVFDIYKFSTSDNAFGLYSMIRPHGERLDKFAAEAHASASDIRFVKGDLLVVIIAFGSSDETSDLLIQAAAELEATLPGTTDLPTTFASFPIENAVPATEKIVANSFLGRQALSEIYTREYVIAGDTVELVLSEDQSGNKYENWSNLAGIEPVDIDGSFSNLPEGARIFGLSDSYYGNVVVISTGGRLAGAIGYTHAQIETLATWFASL
jgi:hypothetical protein